MGKTFKRYGKPVSDNFREEDQDNFESYGYDVKNVGRSSKNKKVTKFKNYDVYEN